jgi:hypothetical protein
LENCWKQLRDAARVGEEIDMLARACDSWLASSPYRGELINGEQ